MPLNRPSIDTLKQVKQFLEAQLTQVHWFSVVAVGLDVV